MAAPSDVWELARQIRERFEERRAAEVAAILQEKKVNEEHRHRIRRRLCELQQPLKELRAILSQEESVLDKVIDLGRPDLCRLSGNTLAQALEAYQDAVSEFLGEVERT